MAAHRGELISPFLTEHANGSSQQVFSTDETLRTQVSGIKCGHFSAVTAFREQASGGFYTGAGNDLRKPVPTIVGIQPAVCSPCGG